MGGTLGSGGMGRSALLMLRLGMLVYWTVMGNAAKRFDQPPPESRDIGRGRSIFWPEKSAKKGSKTAKKGGRKRGPKMVKKWTEKHQKAGAASCKGAECSGIF